MLLHSDSLWGCHLLSQFSWRWSGVPRMIAGGADRIRSGSSTNLSPLEYGGSGPEQEGSGVLLRRTVWSGGNGQKGKKSLACGVAQNELLPSFCSSASQWEKSLEGQITRAHAAPQTQAKWRSAQEKKKLSGGVNIMSFMMIWLNVWWGHSHFSGNVGPDSGAGWWQRLEHFLLFLCSRSSHLE